MKKTFAITFSMSVLVLFSVAIIAFMLMLPQKAHIAKTNVEDYENIKKSDYQFVSTKDISTDALIHEYIITSEDITNFKKTNQYKAGNSDPFASSQTGNDNSGNTNNNTNGGGSTSTTDKTTNSNGGTPNPPSTNK
ncbi:MAG: hypothetical protein RSB67_01435 [Clostridia bacterium]